MVIEEINCFALRGDGTLLIKAEIDEICQNHRFSFYITDEQGETYKSPYQEKSYFMHQVEALGSYRIKVFVKDITDDKKVTASIDYVLNEKRAWKLRKETPLATAQVTLELLDGIKPPQLLSRVKGELPENAEVCWYFYHGKETETEYRSPYQKDRSILYQPKECGSYTAKLFIRTAGEKVTIRSNPVEIVQEAP